jgi:hypothetical protein
MSDSEF